MTPPLCIWEPMSNFIRQQIHDQLTKLSKALRDGGMPEDEVVSAVKSIGEKCDMPAMSMDWQPLGGALSFEDAEAYQEGLEWQAFYSDLSWKFGRIIDNIIANDDFDPTQKATAVEAAANDFETRAADFRRREAAESADDEAEEDEDIAVMEAAMSMKGRKDTFGPLPSQSGPLPNAALSAITTGPAYVNDEDRNEEAHIAEQAMADGTTAVKGFARFKQWLTRRKARSDWPDSYFAYIEPGGTTENGITKPDRLRHYPIQDATHVRDALSRLEGDQSPFAGKARAKVEAAARKMGIGQPAADAKKSLKSGFRSYQAPDGSWRWIAVHSNNFEDREGEIFPARVHKAFVEHVDRSKEFPYLWDWHIPFVMGRADMVDFDADSGMVVSAGTFFAGQEHAAKALSERGDLGVSHGYTYDDEDLIDGVYHAYKTFEISPLPLDRAANEGTFFLAAEQLKENVMGFSKDKRDYLVGIHGEASVKAMEDLMVTNAKAMKEAGISFKDFDATVGRKADAKPTAAEAADEEEDAADAAGKKGMSGLSVEDLTSLVLTATKEAVKPIEARLAALEATDDAKIDAKYYRPRAADMFDPQRRPSESDSTLVLGKRGGTKGRDEELVGAAAEAQKQMLDTDGGRYRVKEWVPPHLAPYAAMGLLGGDAVDQ